MYLSIGKFNISPFSYQAATWVLDLNFHLVLLVPAVTKMVFKCPTLVLHYVKKNYESEKENR